MATNCPEFTALAPGNGFITADTVDELIPNTTERTIGTVVTVTCVNGYTLVGDSTFTCQTSGNWSYTEQPTCTNPSVTQKPTDEGTDDDTKFLIGVVSGIAALIIIILLIMIIAVWRKDRRRRRLDEEINKAFVMNDRPESRRYRGRDDVPSIDGDLYSRISMAAPHTRGTPLGPTRPDYDGTSQYGSPLYLPRPRPEYREPSDRYERSLRTPLNYGEDPRVHRSRSIRTEDNYRESKKRPQSLDEEFDQRGSRPYVREWVRRTSAASEYDRPAVHGRGNRGDSQLWRQGAF